MLEGTNLIKDPGIKDTSLPEDVEDGEVKKRGRVVHRRSYSKRRFIVIGIYI